MEDLMALVELFGLKVVGENVDELANLFNIPTILVEAGNNQKPVMIRKVRGCFWATDEIDGVPMRFFGNGSWRYLIDV